MRVSLTRQIKLHQTTGNPAMKRISFKVDGYILKGTLQWPKSFSKKYPAVLFIHGWTSSEKSYITRAQAVTKIGYSCLTFNLRGHGASDGDLQYLSRQDHLTDCIAAYDFLASQQNVDTHSIHVVGASYGGYMATLLSARRNVASLVLRAPALYPDEQFIKPTIHLNRDMIKTYRERNLTYKENKALSALHTYRRKVLLIESENDTEVPKSTIENYAGAIAESHRLTRITIPGANHALIQPQWNQFFIDTLVSWFQQNK